MGENHGGEKITCFSKQTVRNHASTTLKIIRTDGAKEFKAVHNQYLQQFGVVHEVTAPYSSSNDHVEKCSVYSFDKVIRFLVAVVCTRCHCVCQAIEPAALSSRQ